MNVAIHASAATAARAAAAEVFLRDVYPVPLGLAQYLVHVSPRYRYIYFETPKVACSTIKRTLHLLEKDLDRSAVPRDVHDRASSPLLTVTSPEVDLEAVFRSGSHQLFCFVRNPFSRVVSAYMDKILMGGEERTRILSSMGMDPARFVTFAEFLEALRDTPVERTDIHFAAQSYLLQPGHVNYAFIGRFESFDRDLRVLLSRLAPVGTATAAIESILEHAVGGASFVRRLVGREESALIREIYRADFAHFGYGRNWIFATE